MENKRLFIGNLDFLETVDEVQSLLSRFGTVVSVTLKQKKGYAFVEMENAEAAAQAVQQLDGTQHRGRAIRLSFEMKASKARTVSAKQYKERGAALSSRTSPGEQSGKRPDRGDSRSSASRPAKSESRYTPRERSGVSGPRRPVSSVRERSGQVRTAKKPWAADKPAYAGRPDRDSSRSSASRPAKSESGYMPRERSGVSGPGRPASSARERSGPARTAKRPWAADKPAYAGRPDRGDSRSGESRPSKPESRYTPRDRSAASGSERPAFSARERTGPARPHQKARFSQRLARPALATGDTPTERPQRSTTFSPGPRINAQPRPSGLTRNRSGERTRPAAGARKGSSVSTGPKYRGKAGGFDKPRRRD